MSIGRVRVASQIWAFDACGLIQEAQTLACAGDLGSLTFHQLSPVCAGGSEGDL